MRLFFLFLFVANYGVANGQHLMKKEVVFHQSDSKRYMDKIKLFYVNDSITSGVYTGHFVDKKEGLIFYRSNFIVRPRNDNYNIIFDLEKFTFSRKPLHLAPENNEKLILLDSVHSDLANFYFNSHIPFLGNYHGGKLQLQRISAAHIGSKSDTLIFTRD